mgnify:CR=1 FL=1
MTVMVQLVLVTVNIWVVLLLKATFAWTLGFTWKKLSFSAMFQGVGGSTSNECFQIYAFK